MALETTQVEQDEDNPQQLDPQLQHRIGNLQKRINSEQARYERRRTKLILYGWGAFALWIIIPVITLLVYNKRFPQRELDAYVIVSLSVLGGLVALAMTNLKHIGLQGMDEHIQNMEFELDLLRHNPSIEEQRAEKLLSINQYQLKRYHELALSQGSWIFVVGAGCLLIGFVIIGVTFWMIRNIPLQSQVKVSEHIVIGAVGSIGAILVNYVAAIYLKMYATTTTNLGAFHAKLVATNDLFFANVLASRLEKTDRSATIKQLALAIARTSKNMESEPTSSTQTS
jgi:hypothetical protein